MCKAITATVLAVIVSFLAAASTSFAATEAIRAGDGLIYVGDGNEPNGASLSLPCPQLMPEMRPALVFIESPQLEQDQHLYVTAFHGDAVQRWEIVAARQIQATQLDHGIFLVTTSGELADLGTFVIDLDRGVGRRLSRSARISCLRSVPQRGKAMLIHHLFGSGQVRYLELNLTTLSMTVYRTFKESDLGRKFVGTYYGTVLSPDFQRVAYMSEPVVWSDLEYRLMTMDLATMQETCLDEHVNTRISPMSSMMPGPPPLDWIDNEQIVYRHIPAPGPDDVNAMVDPNALCVFKRADTAASQTSEILRQELRLPIGSGSLELSPLNGELIYNNEWTLDPNKAVIVSAIIPYAVVNEYYHSASPDRGTVYLGDQVVHAADGTITKDLISPKHKHLAYIVYVLKADPAYRMYVKVDDIVGPIETAQGTYDTAPCGWVE